MVGTLCSSTSACLAGEPVIWSQDSSSYSLANPTDQNGGNDYTDIDISFDSNDTATFNVTAPDVGIQPLTIKTEITDVDGNTTGEYIEGTVNLRVRPASILIQETAVDSATTWIASDDFNLVISGLDANGDPAPSFGRITGLYDIDWSGSTLAGPTAGVLGTIGGGSSASQWSGTDYTSGNDAITESIQASISYSEAGEVNLVASIENYLGSSYDLTTSAYQAGRFTPAYLTATQNNAGSAEWGTEDANIYQGQSAALSDLSYTVQAFNSDGGLIKNYVGNYVNFSDTTNALSKPGNTADNNYDDIGGDLTSSLAWTISDDSDFDGTITLNAEVSDLLWSRSSTGATTKDIATDISDLNIIADAFTDADDVCVKSSASDTACQNVTADIEDRTLYFVRANLPDLVDGGFNRAEIDITLEALELDTYGDIDWDTLSTDNDLDSSVFTGLSYDSALHSCTLQPSSNCSDVASSALFSGPESIGSNLSSGLGLFTASSTTDLEGSLELQLSAPDWLSWDWNSDGTYTLDETTILFGNYQGQAPVLFMRPGYR
jgi:MSHA biogenesis protein MshQ